MDFDKLYDMFCEYYHDDGSNEEIMRGRIEKAFLKYAQTLVKNCSIPAVVGQREQLVCDCGNKLTDKEIYFGQCLQCDKNIEEAN